MRAFSLRDLLAIKYSACGRIIGRFKRSVKRALASGALDLSRAAVFPRAVACERSRATISIAAGTYILQDGSYYGGKWRSVFQMTRRHSERRHTARVVRTFIRLRSGTLPIRGVAVASPTQSFNLILKPFLYSHAEVTCRTSAVPLCRPPLSFRAFARG